MERRSNGQHHYAGAVRALHEQRPDERVYQRPGLSGTRLARTEEEKHLIIWLLEKDQSALGGGTVGFDLCEMPWDAARFDGMKSFLLEAVAGAQKRLGWEFLDYLPNEELLFPCLDRFSELISRMDAGMPDEAAAREWRDASLESPDDPVVCGCPRCRKHPLLRTVFGCYLCNN